MALVIDTGVLYAALDRDDAAHRECRALLDSTAERRVLPAPILPEVDYWVAKHLGPAPMIALLHDIEAGAFEVEDLVTADYARAAELLDVYADQDIGFVDAAVLAIVERRNERKVATLDRRHFGVVKLRHTRALRIVP